MEHLENMDWEEITPPGNSEHEIKEIRKSLRKRNWKIVLTSVVLVIALLIGTVYWGIPALESQYWDPSTSTYSEYKSDLDFAMVAYSELFVPEYTVASVRSIKTGFASYGLDIACVDNRNGNSYSYYNASLTSNELSTPTGLWDYAIIGAFERDGLSIKIPGSVNRTTRQLLNQLPEYIKVRAHVSFPEDLTMYKVKKLNEELMGFNLGTKAQIDMRNHINWVAIRTGEDKNLYPLCGMKPFSFIMSEGIEGKINDSYPRFYLRNQDQSKSTMDQHFISLLQYSLDQLNQGTGITTGNQNINAEYYQSVLDYVTENGVWSYGCTLTATPAILLDLLDKGTISQIDIQDVWVGF